MKKWIAALALALALSACASTQPLGQSPPGLTQNAVRAEPVEAPGTHALRQAQGERRERSDSSETRAPVTVLVSIDGFRPDYLDRGVTPNLSRLKAEGVSASMRPSFPSITFPNHWTLVTGLRPDRTGIVGNMMEDARRPGETFTMQTDDPFWWNAAEPIWVTAEKAGIHSATMFWPGANVGWGGVKTKDGHGAIKGGTRPEDWQQFNQAVTGRQRVDAVIDWLRRPAVTRPRFVTLYFDIVDSAGHASGPNGKETIAAVAEVDRLIGRLTAGLDDLGQPSNLVIVADHGMAATSDSRTIAADRIADPADYRLFESGPYATFYPVAGHEAALEKALLRPHDHYACWRKANIPARLRYGTNPRIPPYLCLAETGWLIVKAAPEKPFSGGAHGYDNGAPDMAALFLANGPAFAHGQRLPSFDNVDVAPLLRDLLGLPAGQGLDGDDAPFKDVLKR